jgi:hypothetical protein
MWRCRRSRCSCSNGSGESRPCRPSPWRYFLVDEHRSRSFNVVGVQKRGDGSGERQIVDAKLREQCSFVDKLLAEDEPVLNTMRFRKGVLVASDRHLARYFKYVSEFPRGAPPSE